MLNSKKDVAIKRYLSTVGKLESASKIYNSRYYSITYSDNLKIIARFSDHFNSDSKKKDIDIVKLSNGLYIIKSNISINVTLSENTIIPYLKSLLTTYPEIASTLDILKSASFKMQNELINKESKIKKLEADIKIKEDQYDLINDVYEENKVLKHENNNLKGTIKIQKEQYAILKSRYNSISEKYSKLQSLKKILLDNL